MKRLVLALAMATSCVHPTGEHALTGEPRQPFAGEVKVMVDGAALELPYEEVAIVSATGSGLDAALPQIIAALQEETRKVGGNAVIRVRYDRGSSSASAIGVAVWMDGLPAPAPPEPGPAPPPCDALDSSGRGPEMDPFVKLAAPGNCR